MSRSAHFICVALVAVPLAACDARWEDGALYAPGWTGPSPSQQAAQQAAYDASMEPQRQAQAEARKQAKAQDDAELWALATALFNDGWTEADIRAAAVLPRPDIWRLIAEREAAAKWLKAHPGQELPVYLWPSEIGYRSPPAPVLIMPPPPMSMSCTTSPIGETLYTNCY
jgi:hypothetical protein